MEKNLRNYVTIYKNAISNNVCKRSLDILKDVEWKTHQFYHARENYYESKEKDCSSYFEKIDTCEELMEIIWNCLHIYVTDLKFPWYNAWEGYSKIKFNRYDKNTQMALHCDHITDLFDRKGIPVLTIIGLFNNDFKGGEFVLFEDEIIPLEAGDIIIFPSVFLYPHNVNEITEGIRYSFASWAW